MKTKLKIVLIALLVMIVSSCKKYLDIGPPVTKVVSSNVFTSDQSALSAVSALYVQGSFTSTSSSIEGSFIGAITALGGAASDDIYSISGAATGGNNYNEFFNNTLEPLNAYTDYIWQFGYPQVYYINSYIAGLNASTGVSTATKNQLLGECYFFRAFMYFYLTNYYGDVPLVTSTDPSVNATIARTSQATIFSQIVTDLKTAQGLLTNTYPSANKARIALPVVNALLARVYLYQKDYVNAEAAASLVIGNSQFSLASLATAFTNTSPETIWQLATFNGYTGFGANFNPTSATPNYVMYPVLASSFEAGDQRFTNWAKPIVVGATTYYYPYKYKIQTSSIPATTNPGSNEFVVVMRLAEQYLIRAEARAQQNNVSGSTQDLNAIRTRAGLPNTTATDQASLLLAIENERYHELFAEFGHRWLDLKRTGRAVTVLTADKGWTAAKAFQLLFPINQNELNFDPKLVQNPGY